MLDLLAMMKTAAQVAFTTPERRQILLYTLNDWAVNQTD